MERIYNTTDKSGWGDGPWVGEPDKVQWIDEATGLDCLAVRNVDVGGQWCGYVGIPDSHPMHGVDYNEVDSLLSCHGGLTFSDSCHVGGDEASAICHVPEPGRPDNVWWLGFDCAHYLDICPLLVKKLADIRSFSSTAPSQEQVYRDLDYIKGECRDLAAQLAAIKA